jgi:PAS domain-containing protein
MSPSRERIDQLTGELMDAQQRITRLEEDLSVLKKRHEDNLEKLEILNRHFALANDIMYIYDTNFNVLSVSPNVEKLLGYKPEEIIGRPFHELGVVDEMDLENREAPSMQPSTGL